MNVLVIGCGRLGSRLAQKLDEKGHDVSVVDANEENFRRLKNFNGVTFTGMPMDLQILRDAGIESCDAVAVATPDDNLNITVCQIATKFFGVQNVVARISDPAREKVFSTFGLKAVCHTNLACDSMLTVLTQPWEEKSVSFDATTVSFSCYEAEKSMVGCNLNMIPSRPKQCIYGVIHKDGNMELYQEPCHSIIAEGDRLVYSQIID